MLPIEISASEKSCVEGYSDVIFAKDQPEYLPLPALVNDNGVCISKWTLSDKEIKDIFDNRCIYLKVLTFKESLQPVLLSTRIEEL